MSAPAKAPVARVIPAVCDSFAPAPGGAHHWCDACGWRWNLHTGEVERRGQVARVATPTVLRLEADARHLAVLDGEVQAS